MSMAAKIQKLTNQQKSESHSLRDLHPFLVNPTPPRWMWKEISLVTRTNHVIFLPLSRLWDI